MTGKKTTENDFKGQTSKKQRRLQALDFGLAVFINEYISVKLSQVAYLFMSASISSTSTGI